jgi:hypothetical protein
MDGTQTGSAAARALAARRWGASKPIRMAQELALRAAELPDVERKELLDALTEGVDYRFLSHGEHPSTT